MSLYHKQKVVKLFLPPIIL